MTMLTKFAMPMKVQNEIRKTSVLEGGVSGVSKGCSTVHRYPKMTKCCKKKTPLDAIWTAFRLISDFDSALVRRQRLSSQLQTAMNAAAATACVNPAFAQATNSFIPALPVAVCVSKSIAQGVAGTSLTRCFGFHAASFVSSGTARNVHLHTGADK
ncbi:MAG: hypothetical protein PBV86_12420 [Delftia lacustris]|uniref:hypothetical protein n=1 Tax=Delftia TaxID=80865 RepID=UPI00259C8681|nr:hypothetical protein [Delftia sp.]